MIKTVSFQFGSNFIFKMFFFWVLERAVEIFQKSQKKGRPGQPLRFGRRSITVRRRFDDDEYDYWLNCFFLSYSNLRYIFGNAIFCTVSVIFFINVCLTVCMYVQFIKSNDQQQFSAWWILNWAFDVWCPQV